MEDQPALMSIGDFESANPYAPPPPRCRPSAVASLRLDHNSGKHSALFNTACQVKGLTPDFVFQEPKQGAFVVTLRVDNQTLHQAGPYATKKDAKEAVCKMSIGKLEAFEDRSKSLSVALSMEGLAAVSSILIEENWTGTLTEYCTNNKMPYPTYSESYTHVSRGPHFCTVRFHGSPLTDFGSTSLGYKTKKEAKQAASMAAVLWLRDQGGLAGLANMKGSELNDRTDALGLRQAFDSAMDLDSGGRAPQGSIGKQVQDMCFSLGFSSPEFKVVPLVGSFYNMHARFLPRDIAIEPRLSGSVASVSKIYGKKAAKKECWRKLLKVLEGVRRSRLPPMD